MEAVLATAASATTAKTSGHLAHAHCALIRSSFVDWQPLPTLGGRRRGRITEIRELRRKFGTRADTELLEDVTQVRLDRVRREEELGCDLAVRVSLGHQAGDDELLGRQISPRGVLAAARALSRRRQFG